MTPITRRALLILACTFSAIGFVQADPPEAKTEKPAAQELFDGKTLDGWKVTQYGGQGPVEVEEGQLMLRLGDGCTGVTWQKEFPKIDYEIELDAMRVEGTDFFCGLTFPVGESPCSLIVGGWGGAVVGLSSLDGKDAARNETTKYMKFKTGQWYHIKLQVTGEKITAWIDKEKVVEVNHKDHKLSIRPEVELSRPFGICAWNTTAALRKIELRELKAAQTPDAKPVE